MKKKYLFAIILICLFLAGCGSSKQTEKQLAFEQQAECLTHVNDCPIAGPNSDSCSNSTFYSKYYNSCICEMYCSNSENVKFEYMLYDLFSNRYIVDCYGALLIRPETINIFDKKLSKKVKYPEDGICHDILESFIGYIR